MNHRVYAAIIVATVALTGCMTAPEHRAAVEAGGTNNLTAGTVQREIRIGMSSAEVVEALGSPNLVTTDKQRRGKCGSTTRFPPSASCRAAAPMAR